MRKALSTAGLCLLAGCSSLSDNNIDYKSQGTLPPLEIPPDLTAPTRDNRFVVPDAGRSTATLSGYQQERREGRTNTTLLPQPADMRVERAGAERWLVVNEPVDRLWPLVKDFWQELGFLVKVEVPEAGVMETDWAEDRAKIPGGAVRDLLGRIFDNLHSTATRDKFRTRLERTPDGKGTEIYISHRGVEEVYADQATGTSGNIRTVWQPRATDPGLEAEFLRRLMVRLGEREERAKQLAALPQSTQPRARIVKSSDGTELLQVNEPFDRAWRRVGLALDRVGFTVEDRDRQNGVYFVRYADADAEREKQGLLARIIGTKPEIKPEQYRVQVRSEQEASRVNVLNKDGAAETSPTGQRILTLLHEQLK
ncbi:MAG TPA: outer membrane protein assembly factor BamC [Burkholderiales bacterium]|nr:outer membrane protein assembly factor BamC [Burkholderiales bacterium]